MDQSAPRLSGAPNITANRIMLISYIGYSSDNTSDGAIWLEHTGHAGHMESNGWPRPTRLSFDASRCSSIYGRQSSRIVPDHYVVRYYIRYR